MQRVVPSLPVTDELGGRAVLHDGSVVVLKVAEPADRDAVRQFFHALSPESRRRRFFTMADPSDALIARMCQSDDPGRSVSVLALRHTADALSPIAIGSYFAVGIGSAEVAFAVDDRFHGIGIATVLLERLAAIAAQHGFVRFEATTLPENAAMLEVFAESGFEIRSKTEAGTIGVQLSLNATQETVARAERRLASATAASLKPLLEPASVAVVGASRDPSSIGHRIFAALRRNGFTGPIYPVNPAASTLDDERCYASIADVPCSVDLAIVTVPYAVVPRVVAECAAAHVRSLVVISAGFAELGAAGRARQQAIVDLVRGYGMRMIGPNCMGLINADPAIRLNASFSPFFPPSGRVGLSSQSGALGLAILELATERGVGLSTFVSVGNKADVSSNDLLQYWEQDPRTSVILLYLESFGNPRRFARLARRVGRTKPIVCVKAGRTAAGSRAAGSHTAALAAADTAVDALFRQCGVVRADTLNEMFDIAACLESQPLPRGRRVAIVTNAGGPGILAVDACEGAGLVVAEFSSETRARLAEFLPPEASIGNPVDMVASAGPGDYRRAIEIALTAPDVDAVIAIYTPVDFERTEPTLDAIRDGIAAGRCAGAVTKPLLTVLLAEPGRPKPLVVEQERVPAYTFPENAARALAKIAAYAEWRAQPPALLWSFDDIHADQARAACGAALDNHGDGWLSAAATRAVLDAFALPVAAGSVARTADEAAALAHVIGFPVAAKIAARVLSHKTEIGGVRLDLRSETEVRRAFAEITTAVRADNRVEHGDGVLVQAMIAGGVETIIGVSQDPVFGPVVAFGLGGVHVEVLRDVQFRVAPLTDRDVDELIHGIRGLPLLQGYRGRPAADIDALRELLLRVSRLAVEVPEISEIDLNPVIALPRGQGCRIVDARISVTRSPVLARQRS